MNQTKFSGQYFYNYIQKYVVRRMIEDPNGYLVWIPYGEGLTNPAVKVEVEPLVISSNLIKYVDEDMITWLDVEETSEVLENGKRRMSGEVYYSLTEFGFYKHIQIGNKQDKRFELVEIYMHEMDELPAVVLGGDLTDDDYFESYFSAFVPFANEAIRQYSDWQGVMTTSAFPYREEQSETCSAPGCRDGFVFDNTLQDNRACRSCKGTGKVISRSPYGVF
ncbi:MAG: hypothetical protein ACKOQP_05095, partial [Bacteroidota bacterium]